MPNDIKLEDFKVSKLEIKKKELKLKKSRLEAQEKLLKFKERKNRTRLLIEIGGLAGKAKIDHLNTNTLMGAFLEIKEKENEERLVKKWTQKGAEAFKKEQKESGEPLVLTFEKEPERVLKSKIREAGLRWNRFRKEWQGYGVPSQIAEMLKGTSHTIKPLGPSGNE